MGGLKKGSSGLGWIIGSVSFSPFMYNWFLMILNLVCLSFASYLLFSLISWISSWLCFCFSHIGLSCCLLTYMFKPSSFFLPFSYLTLSMIIILSEVEHLMNMSLGEPLFLTTNILCASYIASSSLMILVYHRRTFAPHDDSLHLKFPLAQQLTNYFLYF